MFPHARWSRLAAAVAGLAVLAGAAGPALAQGKGKKNGDARKAAREAARQRAAEVKKAIADFKKVKDGKDPAPRIGAIQSLADVADPAVVKTLARYLADARDGVGVAAAAALGQVGRQLKGRARAGTLKALAGGLKSRLKTHDVVQACAAQLAEIGDPAAVSSLVPLLEDKANERAAAAADALAQLPSAAAVEPLIDALGKVEPPAGGGKGSKGSSQTDAQKARTAALQPKYQAALGKITGKSFPTAAEWKKWWKGAKKTFRVPGSRPPAKKAGKR